MAVLEDVVLMYTKIQTPGFKYQSTTEKEYAVDCVVSKAQAKEWNKKFKKQPAKVVENDDFENIYKCPIPFEDQEEQYVIKLKRDAQYKDGNPISDKARPKAYLRKANGKNVDITETKLVGNGSIGAVSYSETENEFGTFAHLKAVRVDDLVEYELQEDNELGEVEDDLGEDELASKPVKPSAKVKPAKEAPVAEEEEPEESPAEQKPSKPSTKPRGRPAKKAAEPEEGDDPF